MIFIDTNIFITALFPKVHDQRSIASQRLLGLVQRGSTQAKTSLLVITELVWFLVRHRRSRHQIATYLQELDIDGLQLIEGDLLVDTIELYRRSTLDFNDCVNAMLAKQAGCQQFLSYDKALDQLDGLTRHEP